MTGDKIYTVQALTNQGWFNFETKEDPTQKMFDATGSGQIIYSSELDVCLDMSKVIGYRIFWRIEE